MPARLPPSALPGSGHQPLQLLGRLVPGAGLQQRHAAVSGQRDRLGPGQGNIHRGADDGLGVLDGQPAPPVGEVQHDVPGQPVEAELAQHAEFLGQAANARHVHPTDHHRVAGLVEHGQGVLGQSGRGVEMQIANEPGGDRWVRLIDEAVTIPIAHGARATGGAALRRS